MKKFEVGKTYRMHFTAISGSTIYTIVKRTEKTITVDHYGKVSRHKLKDLSSRCEVIEIRGQYLDADSDII